MNSVLSEPTTVEEFYAILDAIEAGGYTPLVYGHGRPVGSGHYGLPEHRPQLLER